MSCFCPYDWNSVAVEWPGFWHLRVHLYLLTCWRPVSLLHGPASARRAELLRSDPLGSAGKLTDGWISFPCEEVSKKKKKKNQIYILRKQSSSCFSSSPVSELTNLGWGPHSCASASCPPVDDSRPVCGDALQFVTYFGGGSNQSIIWCREPWWGLSLGSLLCAPTFSTCQDAGGECVFIFRSPGGPHDPVRHHAHIHTHTHWEATVFIHIHSGWARNLCSVHTDKSCVFPHSLRSLCALLCASVIRQRASVRRSGGTLGV